MGGCSKSVLISKQRGREGGRKKEAFCFFLGFVFFSCIFFLFLECLRVTLSGTSSRGRGGLRGGRAGIEVQWQGVVVLPGGETGWGRAGERTDKGRVRQEHHPQGTLDKERGRRGGEADWGEKRVGGDGGGGMSYAHHYSVHGRERGQLCSGGSVLKGMGGGEGRGRCGVKVANKKNRGPNRVSKQKKHTRK